jgi:ADP-heptose:LPS heptosyltransferase
VRLAVVKPDHLGDIVLAAPAVNALRRHYPDLVLFAASAYQWLLRELFPGATQGVLDAPHLTRDESSEARRNFSRSAAALREFDLVLVLRRDPVFRPEVFGRWAQNSLFMPDRQNAHETRLQRELLLDLIETYDIGEEFFNGPAPSPPAELRCVGFSVGSGMAHKKWSPLRWSQLGLSLRDEGVEVRVLAGPREVGEARLIAEACGVDPQGDVVVGGTDLSAFDAAIADLDLVIAADGGTAHLASRTKPIVSVFGSSPHRRFCPIGEGNRVITLNLTCSPCPGFDLSTVNACLTHECLYGITHTHVLQVLREPVRPPGWRGEITVTGWPAARVFHGLSEAP